MEYGCDSWQGNENHSKSRIEEVEPTDYYAAFYASMNLDSILMPIPPSQWYRAFRSKYLAVVLFLGACFIGSAFVIFSNMQSSLDKVVCTPATNTRLHFRSTATRLGATSSANNNGASSFRILQLTDIHLGEDEWTDWGPEQDQKSFAVIKKLLQYEQPDLIILGGDMLTAENIDQNATAYYQMLINVIQSAAIPNYSGSESTDNSWQPIWAMLLGNHDDRPFIHRNGTVNEKAKTSRATIWDTDRSYQNSVTGQCGIPSNNYVHKDLTGSKHVFGLSNFYIPIYHNDANPKDEAARVYIFDSGGGSIDKRIDSSQIEWFKAISHKSQLPSFAFQHIPTDSFYWQDNICSGMHQDGVATVSSDAGLVDALVESRSVYVLGVGHNHINDYCCHPNSSSALLQVCFGRHSGYGGYGSSESRGARIYEMVLQPSKSENKENHEVSWSSWVRLETGEVVNEVSSNAEETQ